VCVCVCVFEYIIYTSDPDLLAPSLRPQSINLSKVLTKPHTGKEKPHPSTTTEGSTPCVTKCRRLGGLRMSRNST